MEKHVMALGEFRPGTGEEARRTAERCRRNRRSIRLDHVVIITDSAGRVAQGKKKTPVRDCIYDAAARGRTDGGGVPRNKSLTRRFRRETPTPTYGSPWPISNSAHTVLPRRQGVAEGSPRPERDRCALARATRRNRRRSESYADLASSRGEVSTGVTRCEVALKITRRVRAERGLLRSYRKAFLSCLSSSFSPLLLLLFPFTPPTTGCRRFGCWKFPSRT